MADIQFNEEQQYVRRSISVEQKQSFLVRLVFASGLATTEEGAQKVLLLIAVISIVLAVGIYVYSNSMGSIDKQSPLPPYLQNTYAP